MQAILVEEFPNVNFDEALPIPCPEPENQSRVTVNWIVVTLNFIVVNAHYTLNILFEALCNGWISLEDYARTQLDQEFQ